MINIINIYRRNKMINSLQLLKDKINILDNYIENRKQPVPIAINKAVWLNNNFDDITKYLMNKNLLNSFDNFIKYYNRYYQVSTDIRSELNSKKILSLWLILAFPEFIIDIELENIDTSQHNYKIDLYVLSKQLHKILLDIINKNIINNNILRLFNKHINLFINCFDMYLVINKREKLANYIKEWITLEKSLNLINNSEKYNDIERENSLFIINKSKKLIEKYINNLIDNNKKDSFYKTLNNIVEQQIRNELTMKTVMELSLEEEINNGNYDNLINALEEVKYFIKVFTKKEQSEIDETIDISYIIQLIKYDIISKKEINEFALNVLNIMCSAGSEHLNNIQIQDWEKIFNENQDNYKLLISKLMILCLETINKITEEISCFKEYLDLINN